MSRPRSQKVTRTMLGLLLAGLLAFAQWQGWLPNDNKLPPNSRGSSPSTPPPPASVPSPGGTTRQIGGWQELGGCLLVEDRGNDGDSFDILHQGTRHTIRLYFADCPEKYRHQYNGPRIADQGRYFGGLSEEETVAVGEAARDFTLARLRARPFTILTRWEAVFDSERRYAFVTLPEGDLAELLVREGLARIFTKGGDRPGGLNTKDEKQKLHSLQLQAKKAGKGAWAKSR